MNGNTEYFKQAELALAAYGDFATNTPTRQELENAGLSTTQANFFIDKYEVVAKYSNNTGLSATVLKDQYRRSLSGDPWHKRSAGFTH
ncbi:hypothetical protein [Nitrosomonas sp.]|uniref:hypothetical protein n=1 Tax=Nitrosomonas sp. TaxID=42353 RepID=UPI0020818B60|nr:hypothetical protein [Nitrosomonas sp.]GJL76214.1 MAG: hypothetical protein NMNS02_23200 [Nitrosomonas sp.]